MEEESRLVSFAMVIDALLQALNGKRNGDDSCDEDVVGLDVSAQG